MLIDAVLAGLGAAGAAIAGVSVAPAIAVAGVVAAILNLSGADKWLWENYLKEKFRWVSERILTPDQWYALFDSIPGLSQDIPKNFEDARRFVPRRDPLFLDLDGDGIETVAATGSILFDHDGDGVRSGTGWVSADDGFLVFDRNKNGFIDNGSELFGVDTIRSDGSNASSGFSALADLDSDKNGIFDSRDGEFSNVRVWRDLNQDGVSQSAELFKLADLGVASIELVPTITEDLDLGNGNVVDNRGAYTRIDGTVGLAGDLQLAMNNYFRDFSGSLDKVEVSYEANRLPGVKGSGAVRDLKEAATLSTELLASIQALVPGTSRDAMKSSLDTILARWAATSTMQSSEEMLESVGGVRELYYRGVLPADIAAQSPEAIDNWIKQQHAELGPMIAILEKFNGSSLISYRYDQASTGGSTYTWGELSELDGTKKQVMNILLQPEQIEALKAAYTALKESVYAGLVMQTRLKGYLDKIDSRFLDGVLKFNYSQLDAMLELKRSSQLDEAFQDIVELHRYGGAFLKDSGWRFGEIIDAWIGEAVSSSSGMAAMAAANIKIVDGTFAGSGADDLVWGAAENDVITGDAGADLIGGGSGNDLLSGGKGNDQLFGGAGDDVLDGGDGNDVLVGGNGNDTLYGGDGGTDRLEGGAGDDALFVYSQSRDSVLAGGTGNDTLNGSWYSDTYVFNKGDGHDTVVETSYYTGAVDKVVFGEGIAAGDVRVLRQGADVVLDLGNGTDSVRLKGWLIGGNENDSASIEQLVFADGTIWTPATLRTMGLTTLGTDAADTLTGWNGNDVLLGGNGNDTLYGGDGGTDRLEGGAGDDALSVASGANNSVLAGGTGNDMLSGSWRSDTYLFNKGDGHDTVVETSYYTGAVDKVVFGEGIAAGDVRVLRQGLDVVLDLGNGTDSVRLKDWLSGGNENESTSIEQFVFSDGTVWTPATLRAMGLTTLGTDTADTLTGWNGNDLLLGGNGNDTLYGGDGGTDRLEGGAGDDALSVASGANNSVLAGGTGNDTLSGSWRSDTYLFNKGDGHDTVVETSYYTGAVDKVVFGEGIAAGDVRVLRQGLDVVLDLGNGTDSVRLKDWLSGGNENESTSIEQFVFSDGTVWTPATLRAMGLTTLGTDTADTLTGWNGNDLLLGGNGNDTLYGGDGGTDRLEGGAGDDALSVASGANNSVLAGGTGNDTLSGSWRSDTYLFNKGDGHDTVVETSYYTGAVDKVVFGEGIAAGDVRVLRQGLDVVLDLGNGTDSVRLKDWLSGGNENESTSIEQFVFADGTVWTPATLRAMGLTTVGTDAADTLTGWNGNDLLLGGDGNDTLSGGTGTDRLVGGAGDDVLSMNSQARDSVLIGGTGNDTLNGSWYSDTYLFNKGDGHDTVVETSTYSGAVDRIVFGEGIVASEVRVLRQGLDVVLDLGTGTDSVRLKDWLTSSGTENDSASIEQLVFADGTIWTPATLRAMGLTTLGTDAADTLTGRNGNDLLLGGDGNDTLSGGGGGTDRLEGGAGDDVLSVNSQSRDSVLIGGTGNDTLNGSWYSDTYVFNKGDGHDTVVETSTYSGAVDRVVFGEGIAAGDVRVLRQGADVVLDLGNGTDSVRLKDWLSGASENDSASIEQLVFADGTIWTPATLRAMGLTTVGTDAADTLTGWNGNDLLLGGDGNDTLSGGTGTDRLVGGAGDDVLSMNSQARDSVLVGGTGNDTLNGSWYSDTYVFNKGDGHDTVVETSTYSGAVDRVKFGSEINLSDTFFTRSGNNLFITLRDGDDRLAVAGWFGSESAQVEYLDFQDRSVAATEVSSLIDAMAVANASSESFVPAPNAQETKPMLASSAI
ncbi:beta strand repeat-containing protein [Xanthomonas dyei]|uniref:Haemolysin-type calcium binding-related domain-containing protein n=1 Tax=Xanthomonas dyei TaxID=743699 RepID=A0ABZ0D602_9XANT|nr:calcium-binding protein [Xanthomonas dyei]WOB25660.1 hypothetical protein NYR99_18420 [Xanthomonas dyei]